MTKTRLTLAVACAVSLAALVPAASAEDLTLVFKTTSKDGASTSTSYYSTEKMRTGDAEHETIQAAIQWAFEQRRYREVIELIEGVRYYYNVRGLWDDRLSNNLLRAQAARALGDLSNEVLGLAHQVDIRSKQGLLAEAGALLEQLHGLAGGAELSDDAAFEYHHAQGLYAHARGDLAAPLRAALRARQAGRRG